MGETIFNLPPSLFYLFVLPSIIRNKTQSNHARAEAEDVSEGAPWSN